MQVVEFGKYLRSLRKERKLTIRQVETYSGVSNSYLSQVENGRRGIPSPEILQKLAPVLMVPYEELMERAGYLDRSDIEATKNAIQTIEKALLDDIELLAFFEELKKRDDLKILFKQVKPLPPKTIRTITRLIKAVQDEEDMED